MLEYGASMVHATLAGVCETLEHQTWRARVCQQAAYRGGEPRTANKTLNAHWRSHRQLRFHNLCVYPKLEPKYRNAPSAHRYLIAPICAGPRPRPPQGTHQADPERKKRHWQRHSNSNGRPRFFCPKLDGALPTFRSPLCGPILC